MSTATDIAVKSENNQAETGIIVIPRKQRVIGYFSKVTQFITWPIAFVFFHTIYKVTINGQENFKKINSPFIIVSNHVASYDSFMFRLTLGLMSPHLPLRFMAVNRFDYKFLNMLSYIGFIDAIYALFGVFVVVPGKGIDENLKTASDIILNGGNVVVYPEGKIVKRDSVAPFKRGASVLAQKTKVPVLPISMRITAHEGLMRKRFTINVGDPICIAQNMSEENITQIFYNSVVNLYEK